jgi:hypothetical protein
MYVDALLNLNTPMSTIESNPKPWISTRLASALKVFVVMALVSFVGFGVMYFSEAQLGGEVLVFYCACGYSHAHISDGQLVLTEQNHDTPAGTILATVKNNGSNCTLTWVTDNSLAGQVDCLQIDHLGAKCNMDVWGDGKMEPTHILLVDNWKLGPASYAARLTRWLNWKN